MDENRNQQSPSEVDRVGAGKANHSIIAGRLDVGRDVGFKLEGSAEATTVNSIVGTTVNIGNDVNFHIVQAESRNKLEIVKSLKRISRLDSHKKKSRLEDVAHNLPSTGSWIFADPRYAKWQDGNTTRLWCFGKPGVGKTVLAAKIIYHLERSIRRMVDDDYKSRGVLYVYFDYQERENQTPAAILADLLSQLLRQKQFVSEDMTRKYSEWEGSDEPLSYQGYLRLLISEAENFHQLYLVLDGLDEYSDKTQTLVGIISQLPKNIKVLVMSRDDRRIPQSIGFDESIHIQARKEDVNAFVKWRIDQSDVLKQAITAKGQTYDGSSPEHQDELVTRSRGNFLLAQLQMDAFEGLTDSGAVTNFQGDWSHFYEVALDRILAQRKSDKEKAVEALIWVCYAARPLSVEELSQAITGYQTADKIDGGTLETICAGLITIDDSGIARLLHFTAHEFLEQKETFHAQKSNSFLAQKCLKVLRERPLAHDTDGTQHISSERPPYLQYAADNWGYHLRRSGRDSPALSLAKEFLEDKSNISDISEWMESIPSHLKLNITPLHIATLFGSKTLVLYTIDHLRIPIDAGIGTAHTAAHWALIFKNTRILQVLLERGADMNAQDVKGRSLLHLAISNHDEESTKALLQNNKGLNLDLEDKTRFTPLRLAAHGGHLWAVKLLIQHGANIDAEDRDDFSALRWASKQGHEQIIRQLIHHGASINTQSSRDGWLILCEAAGYGNERLVRFLISKGADLHKRDRGGLAPVQLAVQYGRSEAACVLLKAGADPNTKDKEDNTLLHTFIDNWSKIQDKSLLWILVEHGCSLELANVHDLTPLQLAIVRDNRSAAWLLIHKGANLGSQDQQGQTPLHTAVARHRLPIVNLLLDQGANYEIPDNDGYSPLHTAAALGNDAVIQAFLWRSKDVNLCNKSGLTPLHTAAMKNQHAAVNILLHHGADPEIGERSGLTPLRLAIMNKNREAVALLVQATRQLDKTDPDDKQSYLHLAAFSGDLEVVQTLLAAGISIDPRDARGRTPLHEAIVARDPVIACYLVQQGADVDLVDADGCSALHRAAELGDESLIPSLARHGNRELRNNKGETPMDVAVRLGHSTIPWA